MKLAVLYTVLTVIKILEDVRFRCHAAMSKTYTVQLYIFFNSSIVDIVIKGEPREIINGKADIPEARITRSV